MQSEVTCNERRYMARYSYAQQVQKELGITQLGLALLTAIGADEGRPLSFYADRLGVTPATASRAMYYLTEKESRHGALEFVERRLFVDPSSGLPNNRCKAHYLTDKGRGTARRFIAIFAGEEDDSLLLPRSSAA